MRRKARRSSACAEMSPGDGEDGAVSGTAGRRRKKKGEDKEEAAVGRWPGRRRGGVEDGTERASGRERD